VGPKEADLTWMGMCLTHLLLSFLLCRFKRQIPDLEAGMAPPPPNRLTRGSQKCTPGSVSEDYTVHGTLQARILEWVAYPFARRSSQSRDRTQVSHMAGRFFPAELDKGRSQY